MNANLPVLPPPSLIEMFFGAFTIGAELYLGLLVLLRNSRSWTNRLFFFLTLLLNVYVITNYLSLHPPLGTPQNQLLWIRIVMAVFSFFGPTLFLLAHTFPGDHIKLNKIVFTLLLVILYASALFSLSPYVFTDIEYPDGQPLPTPGPAIPIVFIDFAGLFLASFVLLIHKYRKSSGMVRVQNFYFLLGIITTFSLMILTTFISVVVFKFSGLVSLGHIFPLILVVFLAYAIIRHKFLDIRLFVARTVAYGLLIFILGTVYAASLFIIGTYLFQLSDPRQQIFISTCFALLIAFSLQPLHHFVGKITNSVFYKYRYDPQTLLEQLGRTIAATISLEELGAVMLESLSKNLKTNKCALLLLDKGQASWWKSQGFDDTKLIQQSYLSVLTDTPPLLHGEKNHRTNGYIITFEELEENNTKTIFRELEIGLVVKLVAKDATIGLLILGQKSSGEIYDDADKDLLEVIAPELTVAVQNAKSYEEIRQFNAKLQWEIDKATTELKKGNEQMYEQNMELAIRNRTLGILRNMYEIMNTTLGVSEIAQKLSEAVVKELKFRKVSIAIINKKENILEAISSFPDELNSSQEVSIYGKTFTELKLPLSDKENYCVRAVMENHTRLTNDLYDVLAPLVNREQANALQGIFNIQTTIIFPLRFGNEPLGVLIINLEKHIGDLSRAERETLRELIEVIAIAIERAQIYADLQSANERLKELDKLKDDFVSIASHELRTPMTAIKSYAWMVLNGRGGQLTDKGTEYMKRVFNSVERLINLVNDMLDVSRIESGRVQLKPEPCDLIPLAQEVEREFAARAAEKRIQLSFVLPPAQDAARGNRLIAFADKAKVQEVFENLIGNALKFTPKDGTITVKIEDTGSEITSSISDTGIGISKEDMGKLFSKFGRLGNTLTVMSEKGTGLGLYLCKQYVELSKGRIDVQSEPGKGTTFTFTLPKP